MNRHHHRLVFSAARGQPMAVSEAASSHNGSSATGDGPAGATGSHRMRSLLLAAGCALLWPAQAQIAADPAAPGSQRPTVLNAANGVPLVNITTPSAAGVSRNTYRQFDVGSQGVTALGGASVMIQSGQDIHLQGSSAVADDGITISAARDVNITVAQTRSGHSRFEETKDSGVLSDGGMGVTIGKRVQSSEQQTQGTGATASTVGAIGGDVNITAGQTYRQTGSDVLAPGGDITVQAESIAITEARTTERTTTEEKFKQSGISVGLSNPVIDALQGVVNTAEALANTGDARTQALGLAVAALQGKQLYDAARAIASNPAAGVGINISLGSSKSQSKSEVVRDGAQGSNVVASGNVTLNAEGAGLASNVRVQGSTIESGNTARLHAEGDIELIAAIQSTRETNSQSSKSGSIGMGFNAGGAQSGISFNAGASSGKGQGLGDELTHANTLIQAGQRVVVESGDDTTLRGAVVTAPSVQANIGGELLIESLQDRATYSEHSKSASAGVSVCIPPLRGAIPATQRSRVLKPAPVMSGA